MGSLSNGLLWTPVPGPVLGLQRESGRCWCSGSRRSAPSFLCDVSRLQPRGLLIGHDAVRIDNRELRGNSWNGEGGSLALSETLSIMAAEPLYSLEESGPREFPSLQPPSCPIIWRAICIYIFPFLKPLSILLLSDDSFPCGPQAQASLIPSGIRCIPFCLCIALFSLP